MSLTPPARLLTVSEPGLRNKIESREPYTFQFTPLELEHYSVLVGCKYEGIMTLATFTYSQGCKTLGDLENVSLLVFITRS